jgi:outer membrane lipase/esterase
MLINNQTYLYLAYLINIFIILFILKFYMVASVQGQDLSDISTLSENQREMANSVDFLCSGGRTTGTLLNDTLCSTGLRGSWQRDDIGDGEARIGLSEMQHEEMITQGTNSVETSNINFTNVILGRLATLRGSGSVGISFDREDKIFSDPLYASLTLENVGKVAEDTDELGIASKLGIFLNGMQSFGDRDETSREPGFDFDNKGIIGGTDYRLTDKFFIGLAGGYVRLDADLQQSADSVDIDGYSVALYSSYYVIENLYVDAIASYTWHDYDTVRTINYSWISDAKQDRILNQTAKSDTDGSQKSFTLSAGYDLTIDEFIFGPSGRISYVDTNIDGYREGIIKEKGDLKTNETLGLSVRHQDVHSFTTSIGAFASYAISTPWAVLVPQALCEWEHEFSNDSRRIKATFLKDISHTPISIKTDRPDRDFVNLGFGLSSVFVKGRSAFVYYNTVVGLDDVTSHALTAGLRFEF